LDVQGTCSWEAVLNHPPPTVQDRNHQTDVSAAFLICRVRSRLCAVPLEHVSETMRPLPVEPLAGMPLFVLGLSVVRGTPMPVIDAARMLGEADTSCPARFVSLRIGARGAVLAVDSVLGVRAVAGDSVAALPPLLVDASTEVVEAVGMLDSHLLLVLRSGRIVPASVWLALHTEDAA
jgi:purine-binding chemotaxis protein CheW